VQEKEEKEEKEEREEEKEEEREEEEEALIEYSTGSLAGFSFTVGKLNVFIQQAFLLLS